MNSIINNDIITTNEKGDSLTYADMQELIRKEISKLYYKYSTIQADYEIEDIVEEVTLYYLSPMKHTNETRLEHYVKMYNEDITHLTNLIKLTSRQWLNMVLRDKHIKHKAISLNNIILGVGERVAELQDLIADESIDLETKLLEKDFLNNLLKDLRNYNKTYLYECAKKKNKLMSELEFMCDPHNLIDVHKLTEEHLNLIKDIIAGYKKKELKLKYEDYNYLIKGVKTVLSQNYKKVRTNSI